MSGSLRRWLIAGLLLFALPSLADAPVEVQPFEPPPGLEQGWYARIETRFGQIIARLLPEQAPQSVAHFAAFAEGRMAWKDFVTGETRQERFYDGIAIQKALAGQRIEVGDRSGKGHSAPVMYVPMEGAGPVNFYGAGRLGMTRFGGSRISAVQFFISVSAQPFLNGKHPCFGEIIYGKETAMQISQVKTYNNSRPIEPVVIDEIRIFAVGDPDPLPQPKPHQPRSHTLQMREGIRPN